MKNSKSKALEKAKGGKKHQSVIVPDTDKERASFQKSEDKRYGYK